jgi:signal peptidase I
MLRWFIRALAIVVFAFSALVILDYAEILVAVEPDDTASMANTIPPCDGHVVAQGLGYKLWWEPSPGDVVLVHAAVTDEGEIVPDRDADDRTLILRVAAGPGDVIVGREGTVFVDEIKFDDITTEPFPPVTVPNEQYFLLGDNRSAAIDSRTFGPVLGDAIFARVFAVFWPLRDISFRLGQGSGASPGTIDCSS